MTTTINSIKEQISTMSTADLKALHSAIVGQLNYRKHMELHRAKSQLYIGAVCKVDHPKAYGKTFRVEKINPKNVICRDNATGGKWTITASMLEVIG